MHPAEAGVHPCHAAELNPSESQDRDMCETQRLVPTSRWSCQPLVGFGDSVYPGSIGLESVVSPGFRSHEPGRE